MVKWNPFSKKPAAETEAAAKPDVPLTDGTSSEVASSAVAPSAVEQTTPPGEVEETTSEPKPAGGILGRFRTALKKTVSVLNTDIRDLVGKDGRLVDEDFLSELFASLIKTDMGAKSANLIRDRIGTEFRGRKVHMEQLVESAKATITEIMQQDSADIATAATGPTVIMVVGVNGAGKTTSIAKLAHRFREAGKSVVLGAGDTFRAAAVEQLTVWAGRMDAQIITGRQGSNPATVAYKAVEAARDSNADICIVDTAGRLQTQSNLMQELTSIRNVMQKVVPEAPHEVLLVLDATAGQNAISQARGFSDAAGCTGIVLAKMDGTAKGGVAIPIREEFDLPVKFIGLGETPDALAAFDVARYVQALFDE